MKTQNTFRESVLGIVRGIPEGETLSYAEVARRAGSPGAARAVGNIMASNHDPAVPCHRVIKSNGETGGFNQGEEAKKMLLQKEKAALDS